jgi:hypothetical protein
MPSKQMLLGLLSLSTSLAACNSAKAPSSDPIRSQQQAKPTIVKQEKFVGVILPADSTQFPGLYPAGTTYWTPTESDVLELEGNLVPFLEKSKNPHAPEVLKQIEKYKRQYRGIVVGGHRQIVLRFLCDTRIPTIDENWMKEEVIMTDGGSCFFEVRFSTETKKFSDLFINGEA